MLCPYLEAKDKYNARDFAWNYWFFQRDSSLDTAYYPSDRDTIDIVDFLYAIQNDIYFLYPGYSVYTPERGWHVPDINVWESAEQYDISSYFDVVKALSKLPQSFGYYRDLRKAYLNALGKKAVDYPQAAKVVNWLNGRLVNELIKEWQSA